MPTSNPAPPSAAGPRSHHPLAVVGKTAAAKVLVLGMSGLLGIITSRLIISEYGVDAYAQYGLLGTIHTLMPFADLGISAAVLNAIASSPDPANDLQVRRLLTSALRIMIVSGLSIAAVAVAIGLLGWWPTLLGDGLMPGGELVASICVVLFALTLPLTIGQRILVGLGRNPLQTATQALVQPFMLGSISLLVVLSVNAGSYLSILTFIAAALVSVTCLSLGAHLLRPQVGAAFAAVPKVRSVPSVTVMDVAWPMLAQMLVMPVVLQSDRLMLSHLSSGHELARYTLAAQLFGLVLQTIMAAGVSLWPIFARARHDGEVRSPFPLAWCFLAGALVLSLALVAVMPYIAEIVSDGELEVGGWLAFGFVAFICAQAAKYPLGMYMTDVAGLRFQVPPIVLMIPINFGVTLMLIDSLGAAAPVIASAVSVALCQVIPCAYYVRRDLARRRSSQSTPQSQELR